MGVWDKIEKAVYSIAEGIGRKFEQGTALPGRGAGFARTGLKSVVSGIRGFSAPAAMGGFQKKLRGAGFVGSPNEYFENLGAATERFGGAAAGLAGRGVRGAAGGIQRAADTFRKHRDPATGRFVQGWGSRAGSAIRGLLGGNAAASSGGSAEPAGKLNTQLKKLTAPAGVPLVTKLFAALGQYTALRGAVELFKKFTFGMSDANRDLAKWNGAIAASFAKLDIQSMRLDIQQARATAGGATGLNEALSELKTEFQPIREDLGRLLNITGIASVNLLRATLSAVKTFAAGNDLLKGIHAGIEDMEKELKKGKDQGFLGNAALSAIAALPGANPRPVHDDKHKAHGAFIAKPGGLNGNAAFPGLANHKGV